MGKRRVQIVTEVDSALWEKFREQAFAENLTTGQLLDKLIATYLETVQGHQEEDTFYLSFVECLNFFQAV